MGSMRKTNDCKAAQHPDTMKCEHNECENMVHNMSSREIRVKMSKAPRPQRGFPDVNGGTKFLFSQTAPQLIGSPLACQTTS